MSVASALAEIDNRGIELWFEGDRLRFRAPKGALSAEHRAWISKNREAVLAELVSNARQRTSAHPVSFGQKAMWFIHQQAPSNSAYHVSIPARVRCEVVAGSLRNAVQALLDRHASLRTTFKVENGELQQIVAGWAAADFEEISAAGLSDAALQQQVEDEIARPFDLSNDPMLRVSLFTRAPNDHVLLMTAHHIAVDGWSSLILFDEMTKLYQEFVGKGQVELGTPSADYVAYTIRQNAMLEGPEGERLWNYWRDRMAPPREPLRLPLDRPTPPIPSYKGGSAAIPLSPVLTQRMRELGTGLGVTPYVVWLATFKAYLAQLTGSRDIIVGTPTFGRSTAELMPVVGNFVNSVPLRSRVDAGTSLTSLALSLRGTVMEAMEAQQFPFSRLVQLLQPDQASRQVPLFNVFFTFQRFDQFKHVYTITPATVGGLDLARFPVQERTAQFDLSLQVIEVDDTVSAAFGYSDDVFDTATVEGLAQDYSAFVERLLTRPSQALELTRESGPPEPDAQLEDLLARLADADVQITVSDKRLKLNAPKGAINEDLRAEIVANREKLLARLAHPRRDLSRSLVRIPRTGTVPLSASQRRLWFNTRMHPDGNQYNIGGALCLSGPLDIAVLRHTIEQLLHRHETLRMTIGDRDGEPDARIHPPDDSAQVLPVFSVGSPEEAKALAENLIREPFDVSKGPLARFQLLRLGPEEHVLASCLHHVIADGWSLSILLQDAWEIYESSLASRAPKLPELLLGAVDYAAWENRQTNADRWAKQVAFWRTELAGAPALLDIPTDRPRPAKASFRGRRMVRYLDRKLVERLRSCAQRHGATLFMIMLGAWQVLLHRLSGQADIVVGIPVANRESHGLEAAVGCLINTVPVRARFEGAPNFTDVLAQTRTATVAAMDHSSVPFDVLVAALNPDRGSSHPPIFQVLFTSLTFPPPASLPSGLAIEPMVLDLGSARLDLTVEVAEVTIGRHTGQSAVMYEYSTDLFDEAAIERAHHQYQMILAAVAADPHQPVLALPLIDSAQQHAMVEARNATGADHDRSLRVHQLVEAVVASSPDRVAVVAGETSLTYAELDKRANQLARALAARGASRGSRVALCVDRSAEMPLAALAILKAGAAYVPLDASHPAERLRYIIEDAEAVCVITLERLAHLFGDTPVVMLDRDGADISAQDPAPLFLEGAPTDLAYLIYTSGSTGRPKGVEVEHRNLVAFLDAMRREPGLGRDDVVLAVTTLSFDIAGLELWLPLANGARVVIASREEALDGSRLIALMERRGVTLFQATPATWRLLVESGWSGKRDLTALCGGEAMPRVLAQALLPRVGALWNMYGPTETTIWSTAGQVVDASRSISIGRPIANTRVYVLDAGGGIVPVGVAGELVIAGEGVSRGYHRRPGLTARAFGTISIAGREERVYRTGDLARMRSDGTLDYLGRRDQQVKVRGYRIELGEIEAVLSSHPGISSAAVAVKSFAPEDERLVGYVTVAHDHVLNPEELRSALRERLPEYMVPAHFVSLAAFPLTPNGKLDRSALPLPEAEPRQNRTVGPLVPMTDAQRRLAVVWTSVLQTDKVGLSDNFFDLGGHSILLVRLQAAINAEFGQELSLIDLFQHTTVAAQADRLGPTTTRMSDLVGRARSRALRQTHG